MPTTTHLSRAQARRIQQHLNRVLGTHLIIDGQLGSRSRGALRQFQRTHGLSATGRPDAHTLNALRRAPALPGLTPTEARRLREKIVHIAIKEHRFWRNGQHRETKQIVRDRLLDYWHTGAGHRNIQRHQLASPAFQRGTPWSAAFISWVMKKAGAGSYFRYSSAHAVYVAAARDNRRAGNKNPFQAFRPSEVRPRPGDLVCFPRSRRNPATYDTVRAGHKTHSDIVVSVRGGVLTAIGGNVNNSVSASRFRLTNDGRLASPRFYAVVQVVPTEPEPAADLPWFLQWL